MRHFSQLSLCVILAFAFASCATVNNNFYRGDVIGFSDKPITNYTTARGVFMNLKRQDEPCNLRSQTGIDSLKQQIEAVPMGNNTTTYYAMELAAKRIKYVRRKIAKNDPATKYYIFLLTDGLDNASPQVAKKEKMCILERTPEQYKKRVQRKLKSAMGLFHKNLFEVYPMLYKGDDLQKTQTENGKTDDMFNNYLREEMNCFRYSSRGEAPKVIIEKNLNLIADTLREKFEKTSYTFRVPRSYAGKKIRMTLTNSHNETISFTARVKKSLFSYSLTDIDLLSPEASFEGSHNEKPIKADKLYKDDKINAYFVLEDVRYGEKKHRYNLDGLTFKQDYYEERHNLWQTNTEYVEIKEKAIDTYFIVVIDGSYSLDGGKEAYERKIKNKQTTEFATEKKIATDMIDILDVNKQDKKAQKKVNSSKAKSSKTKSKK